MGLRMDGAVRKASASRLLEDFRRAAELVARAQAFGTRGARAFALGAVEANASLTVSAAILTAFGR